MDYKYIILKSEAEAILLNARITEMCLADGLWTDNGFTNNYCNPIKHPTLNKWAVIIDKKYEECFTESEIDGVVSLSEDWKPEIDMLK